MLALEEMQFEILPSVDAADGVGFGIGMQVSIDDGGFDPGSADWSTQDGQNSIRGNTQFGRDVLTGPTWAWQMHTDMQDTSGALAALATIKTAWVAQDVVDTPGAVLPVRYRIGDRVRRIYGRPRRFAAPPSNRIMGGYVPITADFKCVDAFTYDDAESSVVILSGGPSAPAGFIFPVIFPLVSKPTERQESITVLGDAPAYPIVRFDGPVTNPYLVAPGWKLNLQTSLADGEYAVVDMRSWGMTALKNGSQSIAGTLGRRQWFSDMKFQPGQQNLIFGGASSSGGAFCTVSWRNTYNSL